MKRNIVCYLTAAFFASVLVSACSRSPVPEEGFVLSGTIDYAGDAEFFIEVPPLHYKYAPKKRYPLVPDDSGAFRFSFKTDAPAVLWLTLDDKIYPIYAVDGQNLRININRADFPKNTLVAPDVHAYYGAYNSYLRRAADLDAGIAAEMRKLRNGEKNNALEQSQAKVRLAEQYLNGTPFEYQRFKALGEYYVNRIREVEYRFGTSGFDADGARKNILKEAARDSLFTLKALKAQRAGIRDITHFYARTFGIYEKVKEEYGSSTAEMDIKRVAYEELNEKREEVLDYITDKQAKAYAEMHLIAERIGEIPLKEAEPSYTKFLADYPNYPEYTIFLKRFYKEIEKVSPGSPAVPFSLKDADGTPHTMKEYKGKYVLLDFWAGWCQPCLDEFSDMRRLYRKYSRNNFEILAISTEKEYDIWRQDIAKYKNPWPQLYGGNGFEQETFKQYRGGGIPFYILIDREGNILRYNDVRATFNLEKVMDKLLRAEESAR